MIFLRRDLSFCRENELETTVGSASARENILKVAVKITKLPELPELPEESIEKIFELNEAWFPNKIQNVLLYLSDSGKY